MPLKGVCEEYFDSTVSEPSHAQEFIYEDKKPQKYVIPEIFLFIFFIFESRVTDSV